jgi:hypothetical protein
MLDAVVIVDDVVLVVGGMAPTTSHCIGVKHGENDQTCMEPHDAHLKLPAIPQLPKPVQVRARITSGRCVLRLEGGR